MGFNTSHPATVTYSYLHTHVSAYICMVLIQLHTVNETPPVSADICMVTCGFDTVFCSFYFVECPYLELTLYTHSQVQKAIDGLTDPKYLEILSVAVDDEDREAILKKVCMYECICVDVCVRDRSGLWQKKSTLPRKKKHIFSKKKHFWSRKIALSRHYFINKKQQESTYN